MIYSSLLMAFTIEREMVQCPQLDVKREYSTLIQNVVLFVYLELELVTRTFQVERQPNSFVTQPRQLFLVPVVLKVMGSASIFPIEYFTVVWSIPRRMIISGDSISAFSRGSAASFISVISKGDGSGAAPATEGGVVVAGAVATVQAIAACAAEAPNVQVVPGCASFAETVVGT